jgi:CopG family nickel-responsive transcriptional regulator
MVFIISMERNAMSKIERFGISLDERLLKEFDKRNREMGYNNRSEAIRDLIRDCLVRKKQWVKDNVRVAATVTLIYDHHTGELAEKLNDIQHDHARLVVSTMHVHLDHHNCLEVIILRGLGREVKKLAHRLIALKGVKHGKAILTTEGKDLW